MKACYTLDENELKSKVKSKDKDMVNDKFTLQTYMKSKSLKDTRELFRIKTRMNDLRANFPGKPECRVKGGMSCVGCGVSIESNSHITQCYMYSDLLEGRDLAKDSDLVGYFRDVMARRELCKKAG